MTCVSNVDVVAAHAVTGAVLAVNGWERLSDRRRGIGRVERAQRTWLRNASFVDQLGLDPVAVLGPAPGGAPVAPVGRAAPEALTPA